MISCKSCCFFDYPDHGCKRFPVTTEKDPDDWCGEYVRGPNRQQMSKMQDEKDRNSRD